MLYFQFEALPEEYRFKAENIFNKRLDKMLEEKKGCGLSAKMLVLKKKASKKMIRTKFSNE